MIDEKKLIEDISKINNTDYGSICSYEAHSAVSEVLRDIENIINNQPIITKSCEVNAEWIPVTERLPTEKEYELNGGLFEVTKVLNNKFIITDYCLLHSYYKTWHIRDNEKVIAWKFKSKPYKIGY